MMSLYHIQSLKGSAAELTVIAFELECCFPAELMWYSSPYGSDVSYATAMNRANHRSGGSMSHQTLDPMLNTSFLFSPFDRQRKITLSGLLHPPATAVPGSATPRDCVLGSYRREAIAC